MKILKTEGRKDLKVLIGTPIHESKDYSMEKWLESISNFDYPFDLLMVDNSPNSGYQNKVREYCIKYSITNYKLIHIDVGQDSILDERLARSREVIRRAILKGGYDAWCSLECDVIAPAHTLTKLVDLIGDYWMVSHGYPTRGNPNQTNAELGISLIKRQVLMKHNFINQYGYVDPLMPNSWYSGDVWFLRRIDRSKEGEYIHVHGVITPILHLDS